MRKAANIATVTKEKSFFLKMNLFVTNLFVTHIWNNSKEKQMKKEVFSPDHIPMLKLAAEIAMKSTSKITLMNLAGQMSLLNSTIKAFRFSLGGMRLFAKKTKQTNRGVSATFLLTQRGTLLFVFALAVFTGCSHVVVVKSEPPGARVRLVNANGKLGPSLGVTPLDLNSLPSGDAVIIEIDKEAHLPKQVVVPKVSGSRLTINTKLQPLSKEYLAERSRLDFASSLNANLFEIFKLQSLILEKNAEEVLKMEKSMRDQWEGISLYQSLLGNFYYLTGDYKTAKTKYEKALSLDPRNDEARNMLSNLR